MRRFNVRVPKSMKRRVRQAARVLGVSMAEFVRRAVKESAIVKGGA
jgi:predicted HicB family RNase H-like nuclease